MHWPVRPSSCAPTASKSWLTRTCCQLGSQLRRDTRVQVVFFFLLKTRKTVTIMKAF
jgi:hypothetical protein